MCFDTMPIARSESIQEIIIIKANSTSKFKYRIASAFFRQNNPVAFINHFVCVTSTYRMEEA